MRMRAIAAGAACAAVVALGLTLTRAAQGPDGVRRSDERFSLRVVASGLSAPWEVVWGPDAHLWITERESGRILRVNPADGTRLVLATLPDVHQSVAQDGLLGLAFHPGFLREAGSHFVYVSFTYDSEPGPAVTPRLAIRRYRYDRDAHALVEPADVLRNLPAHNDHVGGRLVTGPDAKLYLTIGDQGANFLQNRCRANRAQDLPSASDVQAREYSAYEGKVLRVNLDGSIPDDNPLLEGVRSHVFSYGHRNPLGLAFGPQGRLYLTEHGPETDDELNLIAAGGNYGWPFVAGFSDDKVYTYANWSASSPEPCASLPPGGGPPASVPRRAETAWTHPRFTPPLRTFFTFDDVARAREAGGGTIAPGGLDFVSGGAVPGWDDSLLVLSMLRGVVYRVPLTNDGRAVREPVVEVFKTTNRYRDVAVHPSGRTFYFVTDTRGRTADDRGAPTQTLANPASLLEFTFAD